MKARGRYRDGFGLAGWLLADLFLILAILFTAANGLGVSAQPLPTARPISTPESTASPSHQPSPSAEQEAIRLASFCRAIRVDARSLLADVPAARDAARRSAASALSEAFGDLDGGVSMVLTFGTSPSPARAKQLAIEVNALLHSQLVSEHVRTLFHSAQMRNYINVQPNLALEGDVTLEFFLSARFDPPDSVSEASCR